MKTKATGVSGIERRVGVGADTIRNRDKYIRSVTNKLIIPNNVQRGNHASRLPTQNELSPIARNTIQKINDAENVFDILPDLSLAADIATSSILATKDLITTSLNYSIKNNDIPLTMRDKCLKVVKTHFNDEYKFQDYLQEILHDSLFKTGSYAVGIIPESSVDALINSGRDGKVSLESFKELSPHFTPHGLLGSVSEPETSTVKVGLESVMGQHNGTPSDADLAIEFEGDLFQNIQVTDNANALKISAVSAAYARSKTSTAYNVAVEGLDVESQTVGTEGIYQSDIKSINRNYYKNPLYSASSIEDIKTAEDTPRPSVGHPLIQHFPSESVIPIHIPGDFKNHVGYIIMIDNLGNPISRHDLINSSVAWNWINGDASSKIISDAAQGMGLNQEDRQEKWTVASLTNSYADFVEGKLINALKNGVYGDSATMTRPQEVYRIMMARSLAKKATQLLYIPSEQMSYFAFDYNEYGIGRSLIDRATVITTIRSAIQFATMQGTILNATRNFEYDIELDPADRDGDKTIEDIQYRIMQSSNSKVPYNGTPDDVMAYIANAGISFNITGNEYYPSTKVGVSDKTPDYKIPDASLDEDYAKKLYRLFGIDPDLVLTPDNIEFASQVVSKNLMTSKRIVQTQQKFNPMLCHFIRCYTMSSGILLKQLADAIRETFTDQEKTQKGLMGKYLNAIIAGICVELPPPDTSGLASQLEEFDSMSDSYDKLLEIYFDSEDAEMGEMNSRSKAVVRNYLLRAWVERNDVLPEIADLFDNDKNPRDDLATSIADDLVRIATAGNMIRNRAETRLATVARNMSNNDDPEEFNDTSANNDLSDGGFSSDGLDDNTDFNEDTDMTFGDQDDLLDTDENTDTDIEDDEFSNQEDDEEFKDFDQDPIDETADVKDGDITSEDELDESNDADIDEGDKK